MTLEDYNYYLNKAIQTYINKRYNLYDINQQTTDDLRVLKSSAILDVEPLEVNDLNDFSTLGGANPLKGTYEAYLPLDYYHILNCICIYEIKKRYKCYNKGDFAYFAAKRLTSDAWSLILNDYYQRPQPQRPYIYIHNINQNVDLPTNPIEDTNILNTNTKGTDVSKDYGVKSNEVYVYKYKESEDNPEQTNNTISDDYKYDTFKTNHPDWIITQTIEVPINKQDNGSNLPRTIDLNGITNKSLVEREAGVRYGNQSSVRCEIRYGWDNSIFELKKIQIDYLKVPQTLRLTLEQVNLTEDTSQMMEFPDYVCDQIINELVTLVMQHNADPRIQTFIPVSTSIANPTQQQTPQSQG